MSKLNQLTFSHKNSKMASKVVPDAVPAADDPPGDTDDLSKSSPDSKTVGSTGESNPSTEPEATESTAPSELSSEDRPRRPTARRPTHFQGEKILRKTVDETPEQRVLRKKQEVKIRNHERSRKEGREASVKEKAPVESKAEKDARKTLIEVPDAKWRELVRNMIARREGFHCLFMVIHSEFSDQGVHDVMTYFRGDEETISPFDRYKWLERFLTTLCTLEETNEKQHRVVSDITALDAGDIKYDDATTLATTLQCEMRKSWTTSGAVKKWRQRYETIDSFIVEMPWFGVLVSAVCLYLKMQLRMRYNGWIKGFIFCVLIVIGCNDMCPNECQRKWWWDTVGICLWGVCDDTLTGENDDDSGGM